jgi:hypothetical protein
VFGGVLVVWQGRETFGVGETRFLWPVRGGAHEVFETDVGRAGFFELCVIRGRLR